MSAYLDEGVSAVRGLLAAEGFGHPLSVGQEGTVGQTRRQGRLLDLQKNQQRRHHLMLRNDDRLITFFTENKRRHKESAHLQQRRCNAEVLRLADITGFQVVLCVGWLEHDSC